MTPAPEPVVLVRCVDTGTGYVSWWDSKNFIGFKGEMPTYHAYAALTDPVAALKAEVAALRGALGEAKKYVAPYPTTNDGGNGADLLARIDALLGAPATSEALTREQLDAKMRESFKDGTFWRAHNAASGEAVKNMADEVPPDALKGEDGEAVDAAKGGA